MCGEMREIYSASTQRQRPRVRLQAKQKPCFWKYCFISSCQASMIPILSTSSSVESWSHDLMLSSEVWYSVRSWKMLFVRMTLSPKILLPAYRYGENPKALAPPLPFLLHDRSTERPSAQKRSRS